MDAKSLTHTDVVADLKRYEILFGNRDVDAIVRGFAEDADVFYAGVGRVHGKAALKALLERRFANLRDYRLSKKLEVLGPDRFASSWTAAWRDATTGAEMEGFGIEILEVRDGLFTAWRASFSAWPKTASTEVTP
ncbi:nuclear transport factor 2 family protein [Reyranella sp. CPCC 100927]|uniref:nuclear transport factor 2 family protein n=1 Tax=Reyranella sp. CPCC 100927 TaxID=2599616 RepID=UPI0011B6658C|nr:nuclear transport factor 2 family protein [Reyranella sp. CPCC 100927]TWT05939.1 nuclear transport factor 2 family protein [Reyranella sp. CPCC 100927]